jgi:hypothetical protein
MIAFPAGKRQFATRQGVRDSQGEIWQVSFFVAIILTYGYVRIWRCPLSDSLAALEQQRSRILTQILELGDFRSGSITAINGRCGKPSCHCHQPNQPGHGPNFRLTRKVNGKTVSESFSTAIQLRKAQREVAAYHRFRQLGQELLEVNERICQARPAADTLSLEEKKRRRPSNKRSRAK